MNSNISNIPQEPAKVLRFITAGSVDDGKSTLIGRLLFDAKAVFADQINAIEKSKHKRTLAVTGVEQGQQIDFSLLTDGLSSEREQGITIDVAYRYFTTNKRKFIVADAPGHEQYTRNMVTGASNSDVAIILIDITRVDWQQENFELLNQTKRHSAIINLLGLQHIIIAVNKMDLVEYNKQAFNAIVKAYTNLANKLKINAVLHFIPISALGGDNVVNQSSNMPWYSKQTILQCLETLPIKQHNYIEQKAKFAVQYILRQDGNSKDDLRAYLGRIEAGKLLVGQKLYTCAGLPLHIAKIYNTNGDLVNEAYSGDNITLLLEQDIDISRGDIVSEEVSIPTKTIQAKLCWLDALPHQNSKYWLKHTTSQVNAKITNIHNILDIHNLDNIKQSNILQCNDIASVEIKLQKELIIDTFKNNQILGCFILIDEVTHRTVAAGFIE